MTYLSAKVPDFAGIVLLVFLSVLHGRTSRMGALPMVLFRLPASALHEAEHFIIALLTGSRPTSYTIFPKPVEGGWILGSVKCQRIWALSAFPVAMAPLLNLPFAWLSYQTHTFSGWIGTYVLLAASVPSGQDVKIATSNITGLLTWLLVIAAVVLWYFPGLFTWGQHASNQLWR